ncbi:MFS transporter [Heliobacterium chlorum]|uniref:MFS transporter n=1 Tax=Heliobacterium chlorum TaxID=2698 RepID=UPI001FADABF3|nr:MFS transporter [Heliobacterium chlorum]
MTNLSALALEKKRRNDSLIIAILFWCGLVVVSSLYVTIPLVSAISDTFKVKPDQAAWTGSVFSFFYAIGLLFFGPLSFRYGRKQIILFGLVSLAILSPLLGIIHNFLALVFLRGLQGFIASTFAPSALAYIVEFFSIRKRVTAISFVSTGFLTAGITGQVYSSYISQVQNWHAVFYYLGVVYLVTAIFVALLIPKGENQNQEDSLKKTIEQMAIIVKKKPLIFCYMITVTLLLSFVGMYTAFGNYLSTQFNLTSQQILSVRSAGIIGMLLCPFVGRFVERYGVYRVLRGGLSLAVLGLAFLGISSNLNLLIIISVVFVTGISITVPTLISLVGQLAGTLRGTAVTLYTFILFIGATLGPIVVTLLLKKGTVPFTFGVLALLLGIGLISSYAIKPERT